MEIRSTEEARNNVENFTKRLISLLKEKKSLDADIKSLKDEFKEEGVPVSIVTGCLNALKKKKGKTDTQIFEEDTIQEWLEKNQEIDDGIGELAAKV